MEQVSPSGDPDLARHDASLYRILRIAGVPNE